jgi:hypothetical protein
MNDSDQPKEDVALPNVVPLRPALASAGDASAGTSAGSKCDEAAPSCDQHAASFPEVLSPDFGDIPTLFNSRQWMQKAIEAAGAKIDGGGIGGGQCDLDFTLEGCKFNISLRPR